MSVKTSPIPSFFDTTKADQVFPVPYLQREQDAIAYRKANGIKHKSADTVKVCLLQIDNQITFCLPPPYGQLFVGGRSGRGAIDDSVRLCKFIYKYLGTITKIVPTLDTHMANQIFHPIFWVDENGNHPNGAFAPFISLDDVKTGKWKVNPAMADEIAGGNYTWLQQYALHYVQTLSDAGKYQLEIWPYHGMLGSVSHALVPIIEEACFFHNIARNSQTEFEIKGGHPLTENYSILQAEVQKRHDGKALTQKNAKLIKRLLDHDMVIVAGQAKSHCLAWTVEHLRTEIMAQDPTLAKKVYILEDCTSPVVIPNVIDFTDMATAAFDRFAAAGMNIVKSTDPIETWKNSPLR
jgi:nicotinamidase-related amidase